jgi:hypothetical protein
LPFTVIEGEFEELVRKHQLDFIENEVKLEVVKQGCDLEAKMLSYAKVQNKLK